MDIIGDKPNNPVWMAIVPSSPKVRDAIMVTAISVLPIAIAMLMQKPALRQQLTMQTFHATKTLCQDMADFWQIMATKSAQAYQKAQL